MKSTKFANFIGEIESIYTGRESGCRCGCLGNYFDPGTRGFTRALNKISRLDPMVKYIDDFSDRADLNHALSEEHEGHAVSDGREWIDLCLPNDRTITIYYKAGTLNIKN